MGDTRIRPFLPDDWVDVWTILEPVFREGRTYGVPTSISQEDARDYWVTQPDRTFVATDSESGDVLGSYFLRPNFAGPAAHVGNCGFVVARRARGVGVARSMCEHAEREALDRGFRALLFNLVVASNVDAVHLWSTMGFRIVGSVPEAFDHPELGLIPAHIMHKRLTPPL